MRIAKRLTLCVVFWFVFYLVLLSLLNTLVVSNDAFWTTMFWLVFASVIAEWVIAGLILSLKYD